MSYFRESFEHHPVKLFLNSNAADVINTRGDITFNLRRNITLPSGTIGYVSLNELTIPNTNYNINSNNKKIVITNGTVTQEITLEEGNYTVSNLKDTLNEFFGSVDCNFNDLSVAYDNTTNKFTFTYNDWYSLIITSDSTMNSVLGFEEGEVDLSVPNATGSTLSSTVPKTANITFVAGTNNTLTINFPGMATRSISTVPGGPYTIASLAPYFTTEYALYNIPVTVTYDATTHLFTFTNSTTNEPFTLSGNMMTSLGFNTALPNYDTSVSIGATCTLTSSKIVDLSGNNSFYFTINLGLSNYAFLKSSFTGGANVLGKVQLTTANTGIEFYNNHTAFKTRFYDTNVTQIHIVLYDEDFNPWVPLSDWSCVLEMTFYEKYDLTTKMKSNNLLFSS